MSAEVKTQILGEVNVPHGITTATVIITPVDASEIQIINLVTKTIATLTASTPAVIMEYSPSDTDDVWVTSALTVTPSGTTDVVVAGTAITTLIARRIRIKCTHAGFSAGNFQVYLIGRAN